MKRRIAIALLITSAAVIAAGTLRPLPPDVTREQYAALCVICDGTPGVDRIANVLLFVPLGLALALLGMRGLGAALIVAVASTVIEVLQWKTISGRNASGFDIVANCLGGVLGFAIGRHWPVLIFPDRPAARRLSVAGAAGWLLVVILTAWGLTPSLPDPPWFSIRGAGMPLTPGGLLLDVRVAGAPVREDTVHNAAELRRRLLAGMPASATAIIAATPSQSTHFVQVIDSTIDELVVLSRAGDDAAYYLRNRARDAQLGQIGVRLPGLFAAPRADTVRVEGSLRNGHLVIAGTRGGTTRESFLPLTPSLGWAFLVPVRAALGRGYAPVSALWLAGLLLPFTYWTARAARLDAHPLRWRLAAPVVIIIALGLVPLAFGLASARWWEWAAAAASALVGEIAAAAAVRRN